MLEAVRYDGNMSKKSIAQPITSKSAISDYLAKIGKKGGLRGGKARAAKLSSSERIQIAKKAAQSRWSKSH